MHPKSSLLPRISVLRPVSVTMCLVALLVLGAVAYLRMPVMMMPDGLTPPFLVVSVGYRNASPQETDQQITLPLEETLRTVKGIKTMRSYSSRGTRVYMEFRQYTDMVAAYNQVSDRLERLKPLLPEEARDEVRIYKYDQDSKSVMYVAVSIDSAITEPFQYIETFVQHPLERVDGVGRVDIFGADRKEVMVEVDQERMRARGVRIGEIVSTLRSDNFALAGGYVREGTKKFYVRSLAQYVTLREIENIQIQSRAGKVRLSDVASVVFEVPEKSWIQRIDGKRGMSFGVKQESGANIVDVTDRVVAKLKAIEEDPRMAGQVSFQVMFNQGFFVKESIRNLQETGLWGGLFAALVLLFFLRTVRMTAIITLAIPLCVMIAMTVLYFIGWSLNVVTMMGLMVGIGLVVDNAIVILENIYRRRGNGEAPEDAAIFGASEVGQAITMATLTTVVVFLPMMLFSGNMFMTFYMTRLGVPVGVALVGSLFVALLFIPLASVRLGKGRVRPTSKIIVKARGIYARMLSWTLRHRRDAVLIALALAATTMYPMDNLKRADRHRGGAFNDLDVRLRLPRHFSPEETEAIVAEVEEFLEARREKYGYAILRVYYRPGYGNLSLYMPAESDDPWWYVAYKNTRNALGIPVAGPMERAEVAEDISKNMPRYVGVRHSVEGASNGGGGSNDPGVSIYLEGDDTEVLVSLVDEVERRLRQIPSLIGVDTDLELADDEVRVVIDRERAKRLGISVRDVARYISYGLQGVSLPRFKSDDGEVRVRLFLERADRQNLNQLRNFPFETDDGTEVALSEVAFFQVSRGMGRIARYDGKVKLRVRAYTTRADIRGLAEEIDKVMAGLELPRGYSWDKGESFKRLREDEASERLGIVMAVTCVFLLMGVLFESFILPFSVLFSIPFSFFGVYWTLYLTDTAMGGMASVGVIVLIGVVVNNAIVLVDMVNRLRADGMGRFDAIMEAGHNRFRPIMMTTFTTVFGLLPMAVGDSNAMGTPYAPLGRTMIGGLLASTFLTLLVVPLFYTLLDDLRLAIRRLSAGVFASRAGGEAYDTADDD